MMHYPFPRTAVKKKRTEPRRTGDRVILRGPAKTQRRREIFERSGGFCEATVLALAPVGGDLMYMPMRCYKPITWETMHMSHEGRGPRRDDRKTIASCEECHRNKHNAGGKPVARKPGRKMNHREAIAYWRGTECFCGGEKASEISFCAECLRKLPQQLAYDVHNSIGDYYLKALALAEQALLKEKV